MMSATVAEAIAVVGAPRKGLNGGGGGRSANRKSSDSLLTSPMTTMEDKHVKVKLIHKAEEGLEIVSTRVWE